MVSDILRRYRPPLTLGFSPGILEKKNSIPIVVYEKITIFAVSNKKIKTEYNEKDISAIEKEKSKQARIQGKDVHS